MGAPVTTKIKGYARRCPSRALSDAGSTPAASNENDEARPGDQAGFVV